MTTLAELYDLQWRHAADCLFDSPSSGRQSRALVPVAEDHRGAREHQPRDGRLGAAHARHDGPRTGLPEPRDQRLCRRGLVPRGGGPAFRRERRAAPRRAARGRPVPDALADPAAGQPQRRARGPSRSVSRCTGEEGNRLGSRRPRLSDAGHAADLRRDHGPALDAAESDARRRAVRVRLRHPQRHAGPQVHLPRERRLRRLALRPSAGLALRGDGRRRRVRRRPRAVGQRAAVPRRRPLQRRARPHRRRRRHGAPGRRQEHRQVRVRAGPRVLARGHDRGRKLSAHSGEARGALGDPRDDARAAARRRGRRGARRVGRHAARRGIRSTRHAIYSRGSTRA